MNRYEIKTCKHHGQVEFVLQNRGYYRCKKCLNERVARKRKQLKRVLVEYRGGKCAKCGYNKCVDALDFHHRDRSEKEFGLGSRGLTKSLERLKKEADKCDLLCANCHRELHAEENDKLEHLKPRPTQIKTKKVKTAPKDRHKIKWPPLDELLDRLGKSNYSALGRELGVSDNAIRKHIKTHSH